MGLFDRLRQRLGGGEQAGPPPAPPSPAPSAVQQDPDQAAVERYRYMLRTAPPDTVEQAHAEAFAKLTPEQRQKVLADLSGSVPEGERATSSDPQPLARMATRAEMNNPGTMERTLGGGRGGPGMGSVIAGTLLASVAGAFIGTAVADAFLGDDPAGGEDLAAGEPEPPVEPAPEPDPDGLDTGGGFEDFGGDVGEF